MSQEILEKRVLALKYRPHRFEDLVGQSTVSQTLSLALDSDRLSHAYLFSGLRGSGKTSTARIMAKALLCSNGPTSKPCEVCDNCKSANSNRHLDIIEMDAASNRGIDDIKDLIEHTKYKPSSGRFKVFIIDEVHMLTTQAFNALLKTLEEPPGFVKFILATTDPLKLPATILSRTQHFRFNKIATSDVIHHLSHILNEENINYEKDALEILARTGQGSLRDTLTLLDQAIIFSKGKVNTTSVVDMLGLIDPKLMDNIFSIILNKGDISQIIKDLESYEVSQICDEMAIYLKDKMLSKNTKFDLLLFDRFFRILSDAKHLLAINSDGGFVLILTFMKMIEATNLKTIDDIINQVEKIEVKKETPISKPVEKIVEKVVEAPIEKIEEKVIERVIEKVEEIKSVFVEPETKIEELTPFDEVLVQSDNIMDLGMIDAIEVVDYSTPFDELPTTPIVQKEQIIEKPKDIEIVEHKIEHQVQANIFEEIEIVPIEEVFEGEDDVQNELYEKLTAKVYDRDPDLGECFEKNFIFNGFENKKLYITSYAQDEDRKFLYKHFGIIKTFAQDIFGNDVELDFKKEEPSVLENKNEEKIEKVESEIIHEELSLKKQETQELIQEPNDDTGSMLEEIEMGSGCVADMHKGEITKPSQQELQLNDILNSKMLDKAKELFDIKKITVKARS
ncbi:DNA polymerase III, gamma and tau subunits [Arcobacter venerupis]|uniref:DNA polymerase III subunit gamma/tau n=1 Tax=Arcobacter venerupis TaxID=1054033 RepID=A0AAE7E3I5_9BACT|nr:DNA polymerase III subunit gamma/tau [Arcobacter venerupis]QKF65992.1 DNA polymerase III, gamma and tau subunits [Arcobacter venerupis]RWS49349.1 DNA polymerase III subunit gamma/tau [Arcobacter venerupis]